MAGNKNSGPRGNLNAKYGRIIREAYKKALARKYGSVSEGLIRIANGSLQRAEEGDVSALNVIYDRLAGKPTQTVDATVTHENVTLSNAQDLTTRLVKTMGQRTEPEKGSVH